MTPFDSRVFYKVIVYGFLFGVGVVLLPLTGGIFLDIFALLTNIRLDGYMSYVVSGGLFSMFFSACYLILKNNGAKGVVLLVSLLGFLFFVFYLMATGYFGNIMLF